MLHFHLIGWKPCGCESSGSVSAVLTWARSLYSINCATVQIDGRARTSFPHTEAVNFLRLWTFPLPTSSVLEAFLFFNFISLIAIVCWILCRQTRYHHSLMLLLTVILLSVQDFLPHLLSHTLPSMHVRQDAHKSLCSPNYTLRVQFHSALANLNQSYCSHFLSFTPSLMFLPSSSSSH